MDDENPSGHVIVLDQSSFIKIETLRGRMKIKIYELLWKVCDDSSVDRRIIARWYQLIGEDHFAVENQCSRRPKSSNDFSAEIIVANVLEEDRRVTCAEKLSLKLGYRILTEDLQKTKSLLSGFPISCLMNTKEEIKELQVCTVALSTRMGIILDELLL